MSGLVLALSVAAGLSYMAGWDWEISHKALLAWKGAGVGLLAVYAAMRARGPDGWLLAAVMACGALGDVLLDVGTTVGALAFLAGHLLAIVLYLRNRRRRLTLSQGLLAIVLVPATVTIAYLLPDDRAGPPLGALYALGLALMAACAWISRFPRLRTGLGALLFVVSDLLIFAREGPLHGQAWLGFGVWGLYYVGQLLIVLGVTQALTIRSPAATTRS
ncbi:putative membrane protein YhhN [Caulobacter ginsengisoli]|uniref:Membrane protein YhhN n=1 Tax=Caulobacter ginsengisoli TaxID=400775 RepID=A0ABU0IPX7_9CAUL|nr:lysoplasmalogenase family protein [Caulobacter ginsengisoli]MDQ0464014.1 putative membrane protein YhhN [Caulobacter ginsengisoli]